MKVKVYNDEGILVAENIEQILELLELNDYVVEVKWYLEWHLELYSFYLWHGLAYVLLMKS